MSAVIEVEALHKAYVTSAGTLTALRQIDLRVEAGELVAVVGPSGSGKSTLLHILGCLDRLTTGTYRLNGRDVARMTDRELAHVRNQQIGFVFQHFNLLPRLTNLANVALPMLYAGAWRSERERRAFDLLVRFGLGSKAPLCPPQLSGGQQQRVALARALMNDPRVLLADEPTGNLDSVAGREVMELLMDLNEKDGLTLLLVTHDPLVARHAHRVVSIADGLVSCDKQSWESGEDT